MSTALATLAGKLAERVGMDSVDPQELITTLRQTAFKGDASDAQFIALLIVANQYGLNPWTKEIYAFPDKQNGIVPVVGVDGWSRIINENQQFDGMDFEQDNESCTCRIYRKDRNHPICVTEWMDECRREPFKTREGREITGKTWDDDLLPLCSQIFRRDIRASSELTQAEAVKALGFLKQKASEQKVAA
ncbi:phage recombination protein Bet [Escherichia coli]|uniref:phage recombination protein Bet n=1 Tax=Escherichia coli TaxID=562 RepID=UPI000859ED5A|nr:phage recombination protein Bet [Escherichia coli]